MTDRTINDLDNMITGQTIKMIHDLQKGGTPGYEEGLTREIQSTLTQDELGKLVTFLVSEKMRDFIGVDCLLDDESQGSYDAADAATHSIVAEILRQDRLFNAAYELIVGKICEDAELYRQAYPNPPVLCYGCGFWRYNVSGGFCQECCVAATEVF